MPLPYLDLFSFVVASSIIQDAFVGGGIPSYCTLIIISYFISLLDGVGSSGFAAWLIDLSESSLFAPFTAIALTIQYNNENGLFFASRPLARDDWASSRLPLLLLTIAAVRVLYSNSVTIQLVAPPCSSTSRTGDNYTSSSTTTIAI